MKGGPGRVLPTDERGDSMETNGNSPPSVSGKMVSVSASSEGVFGIVFSVHIPSEALPGTTFRESAIPEGAFGAGLSEHLTGSEFHPSGPILGAGPVLAGVPPTIRPALIPGVSTLGPIPGGFGSACSRRMGVGESGRPRLHFSALPPRSVAMWMGDSGSRATITGTS